LQEARQQSHPPAEITAVTLISVQAVRRAAGHSETKAVTAKFVPSSQFVCGVRVPVLNALVKSCRPGGFELVEALWRSEHSKSGS
jgi:hypothetical protein